MKVLKILEDAEVVLADIEVHLGKKIQHAHQKCRYACNWWVIYLNESNRFDF